MIKNRKHACDYIKIDSYIFKKVEKKKSQLIYVKEKSRH